MCQDDLKSLPRAVSGLCHDFLIPFHPPQSQEFLTAHQLVPPESEDKYLPMFAVPHGETTTVSLTWHVSTIAVINSATPPWSYQ